MLKPVFSVVVPTYNYGRFIGRCMHSVLDQSFADWELIITDDQSSDDTAEIVHQFKDDRIRYVRNPERLGMYPNFCRAIELSQGRYIKPLPSDDYLLPDCLESFAGLFRRHPSVVLGSCGVEVVDWKGDLIESCTLPQSGQVLATEQVARLVARSGCVFGGNSHLCFPREAYRRVGGYPRSVTYSGDFGLAVLLTRMGDYYAFPQALIGGRIHGVQSGVRDTNQRTVHIQDRFRIYDLMFAPHLAMAKTDALKRQARRREAGLYAAIGLKALLQPAKRDWARSVLALLREEMSPSGMLLAMLSRAPALIGHYLAARRPSIRRIIEARHTSGSAIPLMEADLSVRGER